jgi:hypothetical protein
MKEPYGYTFFADDVRQELFGKISLMGIYGNTLVVSELPTVIPKMFFITYAAFPLNHKVSNAKLQIYLPEDSDAPSIVVELQGWEVEPDTRPPELPFPDAEILYPRISYQTLAPLVIKQEGYLRLRVAYDEGRLRVGALEVQLGPAAEEVEKSEEEED